MCYSPQVSFSLAGVLALGGGFCVYRALRIDRRLLAVAAIPVAFSIQQFCEGWVWTGIHRGDASLMRGAAIAYLFFALCFWPTWIPYSVLRADHSPRTRWFLRGMSVLGAMIGVGLVMPLLIDPSWLVVDVERHSLHYNLGESPIFRVIPGLLWQALYFIVVSAPLFVSSERKLVNLGLAVILAAAVTHVFFNHTFATVWCFLAASLSLYLCVMFARVSPARSPFAAGRKICTGYR